MGMTIAFGKRLLYEGGKKDTIGLNTKVFYIDQNGNKAKINMKKFIILAKKCKEKDNIEFFKNYIILIERNELAIGVPIIDGINRLANEFPEEVHKIIEVKEEDEI